jgi:protein-L-isoaspartate(D-aspartate) O-methyltransferase
MLTVDAREQMIKQQVRAWDVLDERVLQTLRKIPRERFVPPSQSFLAFADAEVPLPRGQHMLRPSVVGRLLQALALSGTEQVLEIGTGSGFVTACLAASCAQVRSVEIFPELTELARTGLAACDVRNIELVTADATRHDLGGTRFDVIAVTASIPPAKDSRWGGFERHLAPGGRLFVVVGDPPVMEAQLVRRVGDSSFTSGSLFETVIDPLVNAHHPPAFQF